MDLSGAIFVALALVWAAVLVPKALKSHDEAARTRPVERFSSTLRVLGRRPDGARRFTPGASEGSGGPDGSDTDTRRAADTAAAARPGSGVTAEESHGPATASTEVSTARLRARLSARRRAAAMAARQRRRVLLLLLAVTVAVAAAAYLAALPMWSPAVPCGLALAHLGLGRVSVRRANAAWDREVGRAVLAAHREQTITAAPASPTETTAPTAGATGAAADSEATAPEGFIPTQRDPDGVTAVSPDEDTVAISAAALSSLAVPAGPGSVWDPLPMTLPTYVTKPRAQRTVRTIELSEQGVSSSGRDAEASRLVAEAEAEGTAATDAEGNRAVGS